MGESTVPAAERLRSRLREIGWTQLGLAEAVGSSPANVSRWLSGERTPSLAMAFRIQNSEVGIPADAWLALGADESDEHPAVDDGATGMEG
jgi:transcriptional regulator with XRE-family HTH domain